MQEIVLFSVLCDDVWLLILSILMGNDLTILRLL